MKGVEREKKCILWVPVIDEKKCTGCSHCLEFCPHTVYELPQRSRVKNPNDCVVDPQLVRDCPLKRQSLFQTWKMRENL